jgi:hypothetical protein
MNPYRSSNTAVTYRRGTLGPPRGPVPKDVLDEAWKEMPPRAERDLNQDVFQVLDELIDKVLARRAAKAEASRRPDLHLVSDSQTGMESPSGGSSEPSGSAAISPLSNGRDAIGPTSRDLQIDPSQGPHSQMAVDEIGRRKSMVARRSAAEARRHRIVLRLTTSAMNAKEIVAWLGSQDPPEPHGLRTIERDLSILAKSGVIRPTGGEPRSKQRRWTAKEDR